MRFDALLMELAYLALAVGLRAWIQKRRTGNSGIVGLASLQTREDRWVLGLALLAAGLLAVSLLGVGPKTPPALGRSSWLMGLAVFALGVVATLWSQLSMGDSWRIGVSRSESTSLVVGGPFAWVRNPIYSALLVTQAGIAVILGNAAAWAGLAVVWIALEVQVRWVEEPFLTLAHGAEYRAYASRVGRFVPRLR